jgi:hypothetical protein
VYCSANAKSVPATHWARTALVRSVDEPSTALVGHHSSLINLSITVSIDWVDPAANTGIIVPMLHERIKEGNVNTGAGVDSRVATLTSKFAIPAFVTYIFTTISLILFAISII